MFQYTNTDKAPAAIGPYSQAIRCGNILFASGQVPLVPATGAVEATDITGQADQACRNAGEILKANGMDYKDVIKVTCFLADMGDFAAFNEVYARYFSSKPARSCVAVTALPKDVLCEIDIIAMVE